MIRGVAGSIGIILTVPLVALLSAQLMKPQKRLQPADKNEAKKKK